MNIIGISESDHWHIQCIYPTREDEDEKEDYMTSVRIFVRTVWERAKNNPNLPSRLVPEEVECSSTIFDGRETSAIKIRFQLEQPTGSLAQSVEYFCNRIFLLQANGEILSSLGLITTRSIMGVLPLHDLFKYHWTRTVLSFLRKKDAPVLKDIGHAGFLTPWFKGVTLALTFLTPTHNVASDQPEHAETWARIAAAAWTAFREAADLNVKEPPQHQRLEREKLTKQFLQVSETLVEELGQASKRCETQRESGGNGTATDVELRLFSSILRLLSCGFDLLTCEKEIFDAWKEEAFRHESNRNMAAGVAFVGTGVAVGAWAAGASLRSFVLLGSVAVAFVGVLHITTSHHYSKEAAREKGNAKQVHTQVIGLRHAVEQLVQYLVGSSRRNSPNDIQGLTSEEKIQLAEFDKRARQNDGVQTSAANLKAELDSTKKAIQDRLEDMKQNEDLKELFPKP